MLFDKKPKLYDKDGNEVQGCCVDGRRSGISEVCPTNAEHLREDGADWSAVSASVRSCQQWAYQLQ